MPRALTEQEKCRICHRLIDKGKDIVLMHGIRKVSVDDITKAAGMSKGSFYQHFESKEKYLYELTLEVHRQIFAQAEQMIFQDGDLQDNIRGFLLKLFHLPEVAFFSRNYHEISELINTLADQGVQSSHQMEVDMFERLMVMAGIDTQKAKPGVVCNYVHMLNMIMGSDLMIEDYLPETIDLIMDSLITYFFGGV